jgi:hypothetical protein
MFKKVNPLKWIKILIFYLILLNTFILSEKKIENNDWNNFRKNYEEDRKKLPQKELIEIMEKKIKQFNVNKNEIRKILNKINWTNIINGFIMNFENFKKIKIYLKKYSNNNNFKIFYQKLIDYEFDKILIIRDICEKNKFKIYFDEDSNNAIDANKICNPKVNGTISIEDDKGFRKEFDEFMENFNIVKFFN